MTTMSSDKVILVSDLCEGGAAIACKRLLQGLNDNSAYDVSWVSANKFGCKHARTPGDWPGMFSTLLSKIGHKFGLDLELRSLRRKAYESALLKMINIAQPSVINLHNIHESMSFSFVERLPKDIPLVWTLHDMWALTGGCAYSFDCHKYLELCSGDCPELKNLRGVEFGVEKEWHRRHDFYRMNKHRLVFVSPSQWLADEARRSLPDGVVVKCIPNSIDITVFGPVTECAMVRNVLKLPDKKTILIGSQQADEGRKGLSYLVDAISNMREGSMSSFQVVVFGASRKDDSLPDDWIKVGSIRDEKLLNLYYNAADVFVLPSLADNLPNTLLEASAAGTPSVCFDVGGCKDVVRDKKTGFVAQYKNTTSLTECLRYVLSLSSDQKAQMQRNCREVAESEYAMSIQAERYNEVFLEMTDNR